MAILKFETQKAPSLINEKELADLNKGDQFGTQVLHPKQVSPISSP